MRRFAGCHVHVGREGGGSRNWKDLPREILQNASKPFLKI